MSGKGSPGPSVAVVRHLVVSRGREIMSDKPIPYEEIKERILKNPEVRKEYDALETEYQRAKQRIDARAKLVLSVYAEPPYWVSECAELGLASCGDTKKEALANIREAIDLYLEGDNQ